MDRDTLNADLLHELQYYSLERIRGRTVDAIALAPVLAFSREVSPEADPHWWLQLLLDGRKEFPGLPRAYLGGNLLELVQEVQLHQGCRATKAWGAVQVSQSSQCNLLEVENAEWGLNCTYTGPRLDPSLLLALLRLHGYRVPPVCPLNPFSWDDLRQLEFSVELWVGERPTLTTFSTAKCLYERL